MISGRITKNDGAWQVRLNKTRKHWVALEVKEDGSGPYLSLTLAEALTLSQALASAVQEAMEQDE